MPPADFRLPVLIAEGGRGAIGRLLFRGLMQASVDPGDQASLFTVPVRARADFDPLHERGGESP